MSVYQSIQAIQSYNSNASQLLCVDQNQNLRVVGTPERLVRWIQSIFIGKEAAFSDCKADNVAQAVGQLLQNQQLSNSQSWNCIDFLRSLQGRVRKADQKSDLANRAHQAALRVLQPKKELVSRAINHLTSNPEYTPEHAGALRFLTNSMHAIEAAKRVALPSWFHATPNEHNVTSILRSGQIQQNHAVRGYGAYVSSSDEAGEIMGYGRFTFALDDDHISPNQAAYFVPNPETSLLSWGLNRLVGWKCSSIWVRVANHIPVQTDSVAYLSYSPTEEQTNYVARALLKEQFPWIQWVSRAESNKISDVFREVSSRRLPAHWQPLQHTPHDVLPAHFRK